MTGAGACVVIPTLNEINHIEACWHSCSPSHRRRLAKFWWQTAVARRHARHRAEYRCSRAACALDRQSGSRPGGRRQPRGRQGDHRFATIVRVDAHALYPEGYVGKLLASMAATGADSVVVRMETVAGMPATRDRGRLEQQDWNRRSAHRMARGSGFVDHGHHAAISRTFSSVPWLRRQLRGQ